MKTETPVVWCVDLHPKTEDLRAEVLLGLSEIPKRLPCKLFYDNAGADLFEQICRLDEYYLTRTETAILRTHISEIRALCGPDCLLVEPGSGATTKTRLLLANMKSLAAYMPIDISKQQLLEAAADLQAEYPELDIVPVCADYHQLHHLPRRSRHTRRTIVFFPGSTLGNFEPLEAEQFLRRLAEWCGPTGNILIGVDLQKDRVSLERAYNDTRGVTAAFNRNILQRLNRELGADFDLNQFQHRALFNEIDGRVEMHLVSLCPQTVRLNGVELQFQPDEAIITEYSYKYTLEGFRALTNRAGLSVRRFWTDSRHWFGVFFLRPIEPA